MIKFQKIELVDFLSRIEKVIGIREIYHGTSWLRSGPVMNWNGAYCIAHQQVWKNGISSHAGPEMNGWFENEN